MVGAFLYKPFFSHILIRFVRFMLFGSVFCGISAGFFWAAEGAIIMGYPSPKERGFYLAVWQTAKALGVSIFVSFFASLSV